MTRARDARNGGEDDFKGEWMLQEKITRVNSSRHFSIVPLPFICYNILRSIDCGCSAWLMRNRPIQIKNKVLS